MEVNGQLALTVLMEVFLIAVAAWLARVEDWRSYTPLAGGGTVGDTVEQYVSEEKPSGVIRWLTTVDHKDIGMLYGAYALVAFAVGGLMVVLMRIEPADPSVTLISNTFYNSLLTSHGITVLFLFGTPVLAAFSNYSIPLFIGADDMVSPRINTIVFWLLPPAALLIWVGFFPIPDVTPTQTAWTMYAPLPAGAGSGNQVNAGVDLILLGLHPSGVSATMGVVNFIATTFTECDEKVSWANLDIFPWTVLTQSGFIPFAFPLLGSAVLMLLLDRNLGTMFFSVDGGAILWQHLFWFFSHPKVYTLVFPPVGIVGLVLPRFAGRRLFGFKFVVYSTFVISVLSFGVWAHHMFAASVDPRLRASFMAVSFAIAIPSAVKTSNWITTVWNGKIRLTTPILFYIGFVSNFILGGVMGVFLASIPVDLVLHDTYYVVGHFHYIVMGAIAFADFADLYYWFPIYTGRMYQVVLGKWHLWLSMVGTNLTFFAMISFGYGGTPRHYATYLPQFAMLHQVAMVGALILFVGQMMFAWNFVQSWLEGHRVEGGDPWDLAADDLTTAERTWFERKLETAITDDGEDGTELATDGGQTVDDVDADANSADDA